MPSSRPDLIPFVLKFVMQLNPRSILEIGTGFGKYGFLFREYLAIWAAAADPKRLDPANWQVQIDGIECHEPYIGELQRQIYNRLIIGDAQVEIDKLGSYEFIFLGDVIEHFPKKEGMKLLQKCLKHCTRMIMVTTPNYFNPQGAEYGNDKETHHCLWTREDFDVFSGSETYLIENRYNLAIIPAGAVVESETAAASGSSFSFPT